MQGDAIVQPIHLGLPEVEASLVLDLGLQL